MAKRIYDWASPDRATNGRFIEVAEPGDGGGGGGGATVLANDPTERLLPRLTEISDPPPRPDDPTFADYLPLGPFPLPARTPFRLTGYFEAISGVSDGTFDGLLIAPMIYTASAQLGYGQSNARILGAYPSGLDPNQQGIVTWQQSDSPIPEACDLYLLFFGYNDTAGFGSNAKGPIHVRNRLLIRAY